MMIWKSDEVFLDGVNTGDYFVKPRKRIDIPSAERITEHIEIKGRDSPLTKKYGYRNITLPVDFYIFERNKDFEEMYRTAKIKMTSSKNFRVAGSNVYYEIRNVSFDDAINPTREIGEFTARFVFGPFMYEVIDSTRTITDRTTLTNQGYKSQPIITAQVAGTGRIYINDQEIGIQNINGSIVIDSELMNAYRNNNGIITNLNNHMVGDFPVLKHGENVIEFDGDITSLEINPRWRWV